MKFVIKSLFLIIALLVISLGVLRIPAVQTAIANAVIKKTPDLSGKIEYLSMGYTGSLTIKNADIDASGNKIILEGLETEFSPLSALSKFKINKLVVKGAQVILGKTEKSEESKNEMSVRSKYFAGVLDTAFSKVNFQEAKIEVQAGIQPDDGKAISVSLQSDKGNNAEKAILVYNFDIIDNTYQSPVRQISGRGDITLEQKSNIADLFKVRLNVAVTNATSSELIQQGLGIGLAVQRTNIGENYAAKIVSLSRDGQKSPVLDFDGGLDQSKQEISGQIKLLAAYENLKAFLGGQPMPNFSLAADGDFSFSLASSNMSTNLDLRGNVKDLEQVNASLAGLGAIGITGNVDVNLLGDELKLNKFSLNLSDANKEWLDVALTKEITLFLNDNALKELSEQRGELITVKLNEFQVAILDAMVPAAKLASGSISADIGLGINNMGKPTFNSRSPIQIDNIKVGVPIGSLLKYFTINSQLEVAGGINLLQYSIPSLSVTTEGQNLLIAKFSGEYSGFDNSASLKGGYALQLTPLVSLAPIDSTLRNDIEFYLQTRDAPIQIKNVMETRVKLDRKSITFDQFTLDLISRYDKVIARLENRSAIPIGFNGTIDPHDTHTGELLVFNLYGLSTEGIDRFAPGLSLQSAPITGAFVVARAGNEYSLRFNETLRFASMTILQNGKLLIKDMDFSLNPEMRFNASGSRIRASTGSFKAFESGEALLVGRIEGDYNTTTGNSQPEINSNGKISILLPVLTRQPFINAKDLLGAGEMDVNWDVSGNQKWKGTAELKLSQLKGREMVGSRYPTLNSTVNFELAANNKGQVSIPVTIKGKNGDSDINILANYEIAADKDVRFNIETQSEKIYVSDIQDLAQLFQAKETQENYNQKRPVSNKEPQTIAPWDGFEGNLDVRLQSIILPNKRNVTNTKILANIAPDRLELKSAQSQLQAAKFDGAGILTFNGLSQRPYSYSTNLKLSELDTNYLDGIIDNKRFQATISMDSKIAGDAQSIQEVIDNVTGEINIVANNGKIQVLDPESNFMKLVKTFSGNGENGQAMSAQNLLSTGLGIASQFGVNTKKLGDFDPQPILDLVSYLSEPEFSNLTLSLRKKPGHDYEIPAITMISPILNLNATGKILDGPNVSFINQSLRLNMEVASQGGLAETFKKLNLLSGQKNEMEYFTIKNMPVSIGGSLNDVDYSKLEDIFYKAAQDYMNKAFSGAGDVLGGFLGKQPSQPQQNQQQQETPRDTTTDAINDVIKQIEPAKELFKLFGR